MNAPSTKQLLARIAARRLELLTRIAAQREECADAAQPLRKPLAMADAGIGAVKFVYRHSALFGAGAAIALLAFRGHGTSGAIGFAWRLLRLYPSPVLSGLTRLFAAPRPASSDNSTEP